MTEDTAWEVLAAMARAGGKGGAAEMASVVRVLRTEQASTRARLDALEGEVAALQAGTGTATQERDGPPS